MKVAVTTCASLFFWGMRKNWKEGSTYVHYGKEKKISGISDSLSPAAIAEMAAEQEAIFSPDDVALTFW